MINSSLHIMEPQAHNFSKYLKAEFLPCVSKDWNNDYVDSWSIFFMHFTRVEYWNNMWESVNTVYLRRT